MTEMAKNQMICSHTGACISEQISAARAPKANQMDTSPTVAASTMKKKIMAAIQKIVSLDKAIISTSFSATI